MRVQMSLQRHHPGGLIKRINVARVYVCSPPVDAYDSSSEFEADLEAVHALYPDAPCRPADEDDDAGTPVAGTAPSATVAASGAAVPLASFMRHRSKELKRAPRQLVSLLVKILLQALNPTTGVPERVKSSTCDITSKSYQFPSAAIAGDVKGDTSCYVHPLDGVYARVAKEFCTRYVLPGLLKCQC